MWNYILDWFKRVGFWKGKKITENCVQNWIYVWNTKEVQSLFIWNWGKTKWILTIGNCDLSVHCCLEPVSNGTKKLIKIKTKSIRYSIAVTMSKIDI